MVGGYFHDFRRMLAEMNTIAAKGKIKSRQVQKQQQQIARKIHSKRLTIKK